jgi:hypothetical protein
MALGKLDETGLKTLLADLSETVLAVIHMADTAIALRFASVQSPS